MAPSNFKDLLNELEKRSIKKPVWPTNKEERRVFDRIVSEHAAREKVEVEETPQYEERVVAYLDVMGTEEAVGSSARSERAFFKAAGRFGAIHGFLARIRVQRDFGITSVLASGFSDHVVLTAPATSSGIRELFEYAHEMFGRLLCMNQCLVRGAAVLGKIYHEQGIIFGPALIEAHRLEKQAVYPRIVATAEVVARCGGPRYICTGDTPTRSPTMEPDGDMFFLDPLRTACASRRPEDIRYHLQERAKSLLREDDALLQAKGAWLARLLLRCE